MVATRRGTRVKPQVEVTASRGDQSSMEAASPRRTRRSVHTESRATGDGENSREESPAKTDAPKGKARVAATRSRHRSGQSDASEAESVTSNSSGIVTRSGQSLGGQTDIARTLRSRKSLVTEPILESKDEESEAESNCSSVSTKAKRTRASVSRPVRARRRRSALIPELDSDHSEAESHCSSKSGLQNAAAISEATFLSIDSESQKEELSEAESLSSGFTSQPLIKRSTRSIQYKLQARESKAASEMTVQDQRSPKKSNLRGVKVTEAPGQKEITLLSPRRSLRIRDVSQGKGEVTVTSSADSQNKEVSNEDLHVEELDDKEKSSLAAEDNIELVPELHETGHSIKPNAPEPNDAIMEEQDQGEAKEEDIEDDKCMKADLQNQSTVSQSVGLCLVLDSDDSEAEANVENKKEESHEGSEHSEAVADVGKVENHMESEHNEAEADTENKKEESHEESGDSEAEADGEKVESHMESEDSEAEADGEKVESHMESEDSEAEADGEKVEKHMESEDSEAEADAEKEKEESDEESEADVEVKRKEGHEDSDYSEAESDVDMVKRKKKSNEESDHSEAESDVLESHEESENSEVESDIEMEEKDEDHVAFKRKPKKVPAYQLHDVAGDGLFVIDTAPGLDSGKKYYVDHEKGDRESAAEQGEKELPEPEEDDEEDFIDEDEDENEEDDILNRPKMGLELSTSIDTGLSIKKMGGLYINLDASKPIPGPSWQNKMKKEIKKDELLKKSVITPDFEKREAVPPYRESLNKLKKMRREERAKTTGQGWFDMKAPELTEELKNDLKALKMRSAMDPKHFYKKNDREGFPKYFQVGTVVDNPVDYYHSRIPKKERKRTIVEELLADSEFRRYNKKKYQEIIAEKAARAEGKKNRKKKKFRT